MVDLTGATSVCWDVFISHASEDKTAVAEPLARALMKAGVAVWYDDFTLRVGDPLRQSIEKGLRGSKFGVVILSPAFFSRNWPQKELSALMQKEDSERKVVLPIWYRLGIEEIREQALLLADVKALKWGDGVQIVVSALVEVIKGIATPPLPEIETLESESLLARATISPRQTMKDKWKELEQVILESGSRNHSITHNTEPMNASSTVNALHEAGKIPDDVREDFYSLKKWHRAAALPGEQYHPEPGEAVGFAERTETLKLNFDSI
jgi:TIR domain